MEPLGTFETPWRDLVALVLAALGGAELWHGRHGDPADECGLVRRRTSFLGRLKGFRHVVSGLVLVGFGAAIVLDAPWLVYLALGFGVVEIRESSTMIAAPEGRGVPPAGSAPTRRHAPPTLSAGHGGRNRRSRSATFTTVNRHGIAAARRSGTWIRTATSPPVVPPEAPPSRNPTATPSFRHDPSSGSRLPANDRPCRRARRTGPYALTR